MPSFYAKALVLAAAVVSALPSEQLNARATPHTLVPGMPWNANAPTYRKEIRTLSATELNIYYLALEQMQAKSSNDLLSYYRVAGIHGTGYAWDGDQSGANIGYCQHQNTAFPTWHRPYVSLYEKTLWDLANAAISAWPAGAAKTDHQKVLATWRLPYWDWAANPVMPASIGGPGANGKSSDTVAITKLSNGKVQAVNSHNPLYSYILPKPDDAVAKISVSRNDRIHTTQSVRNPIAVSGNYVNQQEYTNGQMVNAGSNLKNFVYTMFSQTSYNLFSNMRDGDQSLEQVHGTVHITLGGADPGEIAGHMTDPAKAAFDPVFFLHHCNVDRLFAMWQVRNSDWFNGQSSPASSYQLHPFRRSENTYWTSADTKDTTKFGYTYQETYNSNSQAIWTKIQALYGSKSPAKLVADAQQAARKMKKRSVFSLSKRQSPSADNDNLHTPPNTADLADQADKLVNATAPAAGPAPVTVYNEFVAKISAPNDAAGGSYQVLCFLGQPTATDDLTKDNNFVGSFDVFALTQVMDEHKTTVKGSVAMTQAFLNLVAGQKITDMKPKTIRDYCKKNFVWKVQGGTVGADTSKVKINIMTSKVTAQDDQPPKWGAFSHVYNAA